MLPKVHQLPLRQSQDIFANARRITTGFFSVIYRQVAQPADKETPTQIAIVVSKKTAASSVTRHRLKRRLAAAALPFLKAAKPGNQVVFMVRSNLDKATPIELTQSLEMLFDRLEKQK